MSSENRTTLTKPSGRELLFTRVFDAPRELVFEAWTEPAHLEKWWGPNGFRTESLSKETGVGGEWRLIMHAPDGTQFRNRVVYEDVVAPERLVYRHVGDDGKVHFETTTTFEEVSEQQTRVTMRQLFGSEKELDEVIQKYGADKGGMQTMDRLGEHLATVPQIHGEVELTRMFDAPREDVFRAWTDAAMMKEWFGPRIFTNSVCEVDAQVGGALRIVMRGPDGTEYPMRGVFREVIAPERLVFSNVPVDADDRALMLGVTTVIFEEVRGGTKMTMRTVAIGVHPMAARMLEGMEAGWGQTLDKLKQFVEASVAAASRKG
jgi:uncharacterized protein YndB with AHSA1/START domain